MVGDAVHGPGGVAGGWEVEVELDLAVGPFWECVLDVEHGYECWKIPGCDDGGIC